MVNPNDDFRYSRYEDEGDEMPKGNEWNVGDASPKDPVNNPSHYTRGKIEVLEFIEDQKLNFGRGNAVKYISRADLKGTELQDLKKACFYLNREIELLEAAQEGREPVKPNRMSERSIATTLETMGFGGNGRLDLDAPQAETKELAKT